MVRARLLRDPMVIVWASGSSTSMRGVYHNGHHSLAKCSEKYDGKWVKYC